MSTFLIIDDSMSFRHYLKKAILNHWSSAEIETYDPHRRGRPEEDFPWSDYDVIFLDYQLGYPQETGLDWLKSIKSQHADTAVIIITGEGDEKVAVNSIKFGAESYIVKYDLANNLLYEQVTDILENKAMLNSLQARQVAEPSAEGKKLTANETALLDISSSGEQQYIKRWNIPGYLCIREIATGSWSTTLLAERQKDQQQVIVKVLNIQDVTEVILIKRFMQEFTVLANLQHPNIVQMMDYGFTEEYAYYSMEYLPNGDLANKIKSEDISLEMAVKYAQSIAKGLAALHELNIMHRDIKPSNILFKEDGDLAIVDLGIAKDLSCADIMTAQGEILGTPFYMSPEQINATSLDLRTDIYSLGILFYELLTGVKPFLGTSIIEVACQHAYDEPPPLPLELAKYQAVIEKLLAKDPGHRYQSMAEFIAALDAPDDLDALSSI